MKLTESHFTGTSIDDDSKWNKTIPEFIQYWNQTRRDEKAFVFLSTDGSRDVVTWGELHDNCVEYAKAFIRLGVKEKDIVAFTVRTQPKWLYINFGLIFAGAISAPLVFTYKDGRDVIAILNRLATCTTFILDPEDAETTWPIFKSLLVSYKKDGSISSDKVPSLKYMVCMSAPAGETEVLTLDRLVSSQTPSTDVRLPVLDPNFVAVLFQTSGSTGIPKVAAHAHKSLAFCFGHPAWTRFLTHDGKPAVYYNDRPFNWAGGWPCNVISGETRVTRSELCPDPEDRTEFIIRAIQTERCTHLLSLAPALNAMMDRLAYDAFTGRTVNNELLEAMNEENMPDDWPLTTVMTGGQPIKKDVLTCLGKLCSRVVNAYGGTEFLIVSRGLITTNKGFSNHFCGEVLDDVEVRIVDEKESVVPVNTSGDIVMKSKGMFACYLNDTEKTKAAFTSDGWFKTDDVGRMTEDGQIFVDGRKSDMILSGGFNVLPSILEGILREITGVRNVMIVPIPDDVYYQVLCACITVEKGSDVAQDKIESYCREIHNDKKQMFSVLPTYYLFYDDFPETRTGKTSRKSLAADALTRIRGKE